MTTEFLKALDEYVDNVQSLVNNDLRKRLPSLDLAKIMVEPRGIKYKKVIYIQGVHKSVHSFVEISTGDIFKPASWKTPAKHKRGNIYRNKGNEALTTQGTVRYFK
ncbi:MAG: hypothetical protein M0P14_00725 [Alkaliphilus sp.]|nr:hypothetical protein [Alkaliphilus sp.]